MNRSEIKYELIGAYVELTTECNLRCLHCYNESGQKKASITKKNLVNICQSLKEAKQDRITFSGGEPFLHPDLLEYIYYCREQGLDVAIISNATKITKEIIDKLPKEGISFQISLNGTTDIIHDMLCGKGSYIKTMKGISLLQEKFQNKIQVHCVMNQYNQYDIKNMLGFMREKNIKDVSFSELNDTGRTKKNENKIAMSHREIEHMTKELRRDNDIKKWMEEGMSILFPETSLGCPFMDEQEIGVSPRIDPYGNVYLCQSLEKYIVGNINEDTLYQIICNNKSIKKAIDEIYQSRLQIKECEQCVWQFICGRGCPATSFMKYQAVDKTDGECIERSHLLLEDLKNSFSYNMDNYENMR